MINHIKIVITMSSLCDQNAAILCKINNGLLTQLTQHLLFFVILWLVLHDNALMRLLKTIHARQVKRKRASDWLTERRVPVSCACTDRAPEYSTIHFFPEINGLLIIIDVINHLVVVASLSW